MKIKTEQDIINMVSSNTEMMTILRAVRDLQLPDWWIGAWFIRNAIWDINLGSWVVTIDHDIDIACFDRDHQDESTETHYEQQLTQLMPQYEWSVTNQPRMESRNNLIYQDTRDAISQYHETATASCITLTDDDQVIFYNRYRIDDVINWIIRRSPWRIFYPEQERTKRRTSKLHWLERRPTLQIINP